jgi:hypothetical protein
MVSQLRYREGGKATAQKASCFPLALSIFPSPLTVTQPRLTDLLHQIYSIIKINYLTFIFIGICKRLS